MKDFNLKITVRSDRIIKAIEAKFGTQAALIKASGLPGGTVNGFVCMRLKPCGPNGWKQTAETLAAALGVYPSDLWPEHMREVTLARSTAELSLDSHQVQQIIGPDNSFDQRQVLNLAMDGLLLKTKLAITMQMNGATLEDIGEVLGVTRERARQRTTLGMRQMRNNMAKNGIRDLVDVI